MKLLMVVLFDTFYLHMWPEIIILNVQLIFLICVKQQFQYSSTEAVNLSTTQQPRWEISVRISVGQIDHLQNVQVDSDSYCLLLHGMHCTVPWFQRNNTGAQVTGREGRIH